MTPYEQLMELIGGKEEYEIVIEWIDKNTFADLVTLNGTKKKIRLNLYLMITERLAHEIMHDKYDKSVESKNKEETIDRKTGNYLRRMTVNEIKTIASFFFKPK